MATTVTMSLVELDQMRDEAKRLAEQVTQLTAELAAARIGEQGPLLKLCRDSIEIVQFAVGNLSPEFIKRWPFATLRAVVEGFERLPDYSINDRDLGSELLKFANECEMWEAKRKSEPAKYVPPPEGFDEHGRPVDKEGKVVGPPKHVAATGKMIGYPEMADQIGVGEKIDSEPTSVPSVDMP